MVPLHLRLRSRALELAHLGGSEVLHGPQLEARRGVGPLEPQQLAVELQQRRPVAHRHDREPAHGGEPPPIPFTVEQLVGEISSERAATAQQACAAFAQLATRAPIPASFRGAVPAVLSVVERRDEHGFDVAARESAVAALVALCACVEGAAEDAVANGAVAKLLAAAAVEADRRLDLNALECLRVLATARAASAALVADDAAMDAAFAFVAERAVPGSGPDPNLTRADPVAAAALDLLCGLASKRSDEGAARRAVVERGAVGVLAKALADSFFFGVMFGISMFAFSSMFYVQLGPVMEDYNDPLQSFISLSRALFGDFDIDEIMDNSSGYLNALLFLGCNGSPFEMPATLQRMEP